ncbi:MAG: aminotransferase class V-fold PLP-dependent enzyme, partial [bacterium]|nr:aminotransferase class V-fold PLP-dependent enzyme [bacterium]
MKGFDVQKIRKDFPILAKPVCGKPLIYLDNAATTQKPKRVIDSLQRFLTTYNSNIHRGVHYLSERATEAYEEARVKVQQFINAQEAREIIFVRGATEAINLVAHGLRKTLKKGDEILITQMEHHSNIVPWQMICEETGATLKAI